MSRELLALLPVVAPALLVAVVALGRREETGRPRSLIMRLQAGAALSLGLGAFSALFVAIVGPTTSPLLGAGGIGLSVRLDPLSAVMFGLVALLGLIVIRYSANYLHGDPRHSEFLRRLVLALASVQTLVLAGNVAHLAFAWVATSVSLFRLLVFYGDRPRAALAARKKLAVVVVRDACLIGAVTMMAISFGSTDIGTIIRRASEGSTPPRWIALVTGLLVIAAILKSAQLPFHGWLPDVVETPTPVSALLHAGIINAGGFLIVRFADVMVLAPSSLLSLAIVGALTAAFASAVMLTQATTKGALAYSTIGQMGFMLFECGLGAFSLAILHIVAHSLYKAHAFLSSSHVVRRPTTELPSFVQGLQALGLAFSVVGIVAFARASITPLESVELIMSAVLAMGLALFLGQRIAGAAHAYAQAKGLVVAVIVATVFFGSKAVAHALMVRSTPHLELSTSASVVAWLALTLFTALTCVQLLGGTPQRWSGLHVHLQRGFYLDLMFERLVGGRPRRPSLPHPGRPVLTRSLQELLP